MTSPPSQHRPVLLTVGHSAMSLNEFVLLLKEGFVASVVDVRRHPGSRRSPQFAATALAESLGAIGIDYLGLGGQLGGRRSAKDAYIPDVGSAPDNSAWLHRSFRAYADYMGTSAFLEGLERLEARAREKRTAIMCAETHPSRCHRRLISDALTVRGWHVFHLIRGRAPEEHRLSKHAFVEGRQLSYPRVPARS